MASPQVWATHELFSEKKRVVKVLRIQEEHINVAGSHISMDGACDTTMHMQIGSLMLVAYPSFLIGGHTL